MQLNVVLIGSGRAASAIQKALLILCEGHRELKLASIKSLPRGQKLEVPEKKPGHSSLLVVANPHGLHAEFVAAGLNLGFDKILVEKPSCTTLAQVAELRKITLPQSNVAVAHGYRQSWGPQKLKDLILGKELGDLVSINGHYLQSSVAEKFLAADPAVPTWKNEPAINGPFDVFLDLGLHWADLATYLSGSLPTQVRADRLFVHSDTPHRDSQVYLELNFKAPLKARATISKIWHGAANDLEITILGTKASARWNLQNPDQIRLGRGSDQQIISRKKPSVGSGLAPFHGLGWLEGYVEILRGLLLNPTHPSSYPSLQENLDLLDVFLKADFSAEH